MVRMYGEGNGHVRFVCMEKEMDMSGSYVCRRKWACMVRMYGEGNGHVRFVCMEKEMDMSGSYVCREEMGM